MARGLGLILGFEFPVHFNAPYKSKSISEFWNRWHISLSRWRRDYLYLPLGGSKNGFPKTFRNLGITFFLRGLWHGAGWTFAAWGIYHGLLLIFNAFWEQIALFRFPGFFAKFLTFISVIVGWVLFRAHSFSDAMIILKGMAGAYGVDPISKALYSLRIYHGVSLG